MATRIAAMAVGLEIEMMGMRRNLNTTIATTPMMMTTMTMTRRSSSPTVIGTSTLVMNQTRPTASPVKTNDAMMEAVSHQSTP